MHVYIAVGLFSQTCKLPRLAFVEIDFGDDIELDFEALDFSLEIVVHQLFISGVEPETWGQSNWGHVMLCCWNFSD